MILATLDDTGMTFRIGVEKDCYHCTALSSVRQRVHLILLSTFDAFTEEPVLDVIRPKEALLCLLLPLILQPSGAYEGKFPLKEKR
jgi:hypothetical protein